MSLGIVDGWSWRYAEFHGGTEPPPQPFSGAFDNILEDLVRHVAGVSLSCAEVVDSDFEFDGVPHQAARPLRQGSWYCRVSTSPVDLPFNPSPGRGSSYVVLTCPGRTRAGTPAPHGTAATRPLRGPGQAPGAVKGRLVSGEGVDRRKPQLQRGVTMTTRSSRGRAVSAHEDRRPPYLLLIYGCPAVAYRPTAAGASRLGVMGLTRGGSA